MGRGMDGQAMPPYSGMPYFSRPALSFVARVQLHDGTLVTFDTRQPAQAGDWPYRMLLSRVVLLVAVIAVSLVTVRAARMFNTMQSRLIRYIEDRTRALAAMSHDLKTPITRMRLRAELLDDPVLRAKFGGDLAELESMVGVTLDFMRGIDTGEPVKPVDIRAMLESMQADIAETGGRVDIEGAPLKPYPGRPQALKRCLANLLENAVKYGTHATAAIDDSDTRLSIVIRDAGPGIPAGELERVFEPFHRLEGSRNRETGGTGLGLTIARGIAEAHGGSLSLHNRVEGGLEARLTLPRR